MGLRRENLVPMKLVAALSADSSSDAPTDESLLAVTLRSGAGAKAKGRAKTEQAMRDTLQVEAERYARSLERLNLIGNVAPMIGLFGTVWGMINAFYGIVEVGGQPEPVDLADGIGMALITTWWGLIVAIPALTAAGLLRNRLEGGVQEVAELAEKWLDTSFNE